MEAYIGLPHLKPGLYLLKAEMGKGKGIVTDRLIIK